MRRSQRLQFVLGLVRKEEDEEAKRMGQLRAQLSDAENKLSELQTYLENYHEELRQQVQQVSQARGLQIYHEFITKLGSPLSISSDRCISSKPALNARPACGSRSMPSAKTWKRLSNAARSRKRCRLKRNCSVCSTMPKRGGGKVPTRFRQLNLKEKCHRQNQVKCF